MDVFNFLVAHSCPGKGVDKFKVFYELKAWLERLPASVDRCAGKSGKIVRFNEKRLLNTLAASASEQISFYSQRVGDSGEVSEILNCDFSASYASGEELLLSANGARLELQSLFESFWALDQLVDSCDYAYAYSETQAFGYGYGLGTSMLDDEHPLLWEGHQRVGKWRKMQWAGKADGLIRDVYPFNLFSSRKLEALPVDKRLALTQAMSRFGECYTRGDLSVWVLKDSELGEVRGYLASFDVLAAYQD